METFLDETKCITIEGSWNMKVPVELAKFRSTQWYQTLRNIANNACMGDENEFLYNQYKAGKTPEEALKAYNEL